MNEEEKEEEEPACRVVIRERECANRSGAP
jgi:hypothetical protein